INHALYKYLNVFIIAYLDNVLVYISRTLKKYKIYIKKPEKCKFHVTETEFLRFIILRKEILIDLKKLLILTIVKEIQFFLGFTNFYKKFIERYLSITTPFIELTKKDNEFS
ncbi:hypothetical protein K469DRAFT_502731, partial [Zopfia rhizophila CBS 207.26]